MFDLLWYLLVLLIYLNLLRAMPSGKECREKRNAYISLS